tara:strand:+ start:278 stop:472 length:195 start_codon:yes stop_codon:yes gene_type:complete
MTENNNKNNNKNIDNNCIKQSKIERLNRWLNGKDMCEICGRHKATVNLELKYGSHRECRYCWDH